MAGRCSRRRSWTCRGSVLYERRARPPRPRVPPVLRDQRQVLRGLRHQVRRHRHQRVPRVVRPERGEPGVGPPDPDHRPAVRNHKGGHLAFGPNGYLFIGMGDGGSGRRPGQPRPERQLPARQDAADRHQRHDRFAPVPHPVEQPVRRPGRPRRDLLARPAQSVALLVRPRDGRPVDRRRRPGPLRGDRPVDDVVRPRPWRELRLEGHGGSRLLLAAERLHARAARSCRSSPTATRRATAPSSAATSIAVRRRRRSSDATCSATSAPAGSGRSPGRRRRRPVARCSSTRPSTSRRSARTRPASVYVTDAAGGVGGSSPRRRARSPARHRSLTTQRVCGTLGRPCRTVPGTDEGVASRP